MPSKADARVHKPITIAVGNRRLLKLADFLETKTLDTQFNMTCWAWGGNQEKSTLDLRLDRACGTRACAMGWATQIPAFRRIGLRLRWRAYDGQGEVQWPQAKAWDGFSVAEKLFGINANEALGLFDPYFGAPWTRRQVARAIRLFVKERQR